MSTPPNTLPFSQPITQNEQMEASATIITTLPGSLLTNRNNGGGACKAQSNTQANVAHFSASHTPTAAFPTVAVVSLSLTHLMEARLSHYHRQCGGSLTNRLRHVSSKESRALQKTVAENNVEHK